MHVYEQNHQKLPKIKHTIKSPYSLGTHKICFQFPKPHQMLARNVIREQNTYCDFNRRTLSKDWYFGSVKQSQTNGWITQTHEGNTKHVVRSSSRRRCSFLQARAVGEHGVVNHMSMNWRSTTARVGSYDVSFPFKVSGEIRVNFPCNWWT